MVLKLIRRFKDKNRQLVVYVYINSWEGCAGKSCSRHRSQTQMMEKGKGSRTYLQEFDALLKWNLSFFKSWRIDELWKSWNYSPHPLISHSPPRLPPWRFNCEPGCNIPMNSRGRRLSFPANERCCSTSRVIVKPMKKRLSICCQYDLHHLITTFFRVTCRVAGTNGT